MTEHQLSLLCRIFGHSFGKHPIRFETRKCDRWDDCNIKEHEFSVMIWKCKRCQTYKNQRFNNMGYFVKESILQ